MTLVANLVGGWLIVSLIVTGLPELDALGNLVGGLVLVTAIRLLRVPHRVAEARGAVLQ